MSYTKGQLIRCSATFRAYVNSVLTEVDPTEVYFKYQEPGQEPVTYHYGTDDELVRDDTGDYHVDLSADTPGTWYYKFYSTGSYQSAAKGTYIVDKDNM